MGLATPRIPGLKPSAPLQFWQAGHLDNSEVEDRWRIDVALIRAHWPEILRIVASIRMGTVTASLIMRQLTLCPRQNGTAAIILWNTR